MLHENLKRLREARGMTQEMLAEGLHVVRQTVSKWEKGQSVPDADMLRRIAELLGVSVSALLGEEDRRVQELTLQVAQLNARLENSARRTRAIWKAVLIGVLIFLGLWGIVLYGQTIPTDVIEPDTVILMTCTLDGERYFFSIDCDENRQVMSYGGDPWIYEQVLTGSGYDSFGGPEVLTALVTDYFTQHGGTVETQELDWETYVKTRANS